MHAVCTRKGHKYARKYAPKWDSKFIESLDFLMNSLVTSHHDVFLQVFEMERLTIVSHNVFVARERALDIERSHRREFHREYVFSCHGRTVTFPVEQSRTHKSSDKPLFPPVTFWNLV